jgi:integrase/recombinase XerD
VLGEQPVLVGLVEPREQLLAAAWLLSYRPARTRRAYAGDYAAWRAWPSARDVDVLAARRAHVDLWVAQLQAAGAAASARTRALLGGRRR